jgi:hypothetical protein
VYKKTDIGDITDTPQTPMRETHDMMSTMSAMSTFLGAHPPGEEKQMADIGQPVREIEVRPTRRRSAPQEPIREPRREPSREPSRSPRRRREKVPA